MLAGFRLNQTQQKYNELEKLVLIVLWATRKFPGFFVRHPELITSLPSEDMVRCAVDREVNLHLKARLLDLQSYPIRWKKGQTQWNQVQELLSHLSPTEPG